MRALSAIDIALWDLIAQKAGQPIFNLLGGKVRDKIQVYNTCVDNEVYRQEASRIGLLRWQKTFFAWHNCNEDLAMGPCPLLRSTTISGPAGQGAMGPAGSFCHHAIWNTAGNREGYSRCGRQ